MGTVAKSADCRTKLDVATWHLERGWNGLWRSQWRFVLSLR
jgi:hypothetical protein